jgi:hypothetical protein
VLKAKEYSVGTLADATAVALLLPRTNDEYAFLVGRTVSDKSAAIFLNGQHMFMSFECTNAKNWRGLLIENVYIEADETSLFDSDFNEAPFGSLIRSDTRLSIRTKEQKVFFERSLVVLETGLAPTSDLSVGFSRWRIMIGEGQDKRVLREINAAKMGERS